MRESYFDEKYDISGFKDTPGENRIEIE